NGVSDGWLDTSVGRIIFNDVIPPELRFLNQEMDKSALKDLTATCHRQLGNEKTADMLDAIMELGFHYASKAGITLAINDIEVSPEKGSIVAEAERKVDLLDQQYLDGLITEDERYTNVIQIWTEANDNLTAIIERNLRNYGGIYLMATSGAKGNIAQIKQMAGMRGLMSDPKGRIIGRPIKSNFREGLTVLEYFISTHGARKGLADTALRTADSGYLTRRLIDVAQEVIVLTEDCETTTGIWIEDGPEDTLMSPFDERIKSRRMAAPVADPATGEIIVDRNEEINEEVYQKLRASDVTRVLVRSPLVCEARRGVCRMCYGISLATMTPVLLGEAVGIIAAQSIGEPGTQLTMRTFHTGGIAAVDITSGLPRVEELFEARSPKGEAVLSEIDGGVDISEVSDGRTIKVASVEDYSDEYQLPADYKLEVADGDLVAIGTPLAVAPETSEEASDGDGEQALQPADVIARVSGTAHVDGDRVTIGWTDEDQREYVIPAAAHIIVRSGDAVVAGEAMTAGPKSPLQILRIQGRDAVQKYLIEEVQKVYRSQGVTIHDKHIEVIISQMLRKVRIDSPGDTELLPGELMDRQQYEETNAGILAEGGEPATASPVMLGITKASLNMDSVLAAASFQETTRVLTESAVNGDVDYLRGLKENVIIGRLIPARLDLSEEGRKRLGLDELQEEPVDIMPGLPEEGAMFGMERPVREELVVEEAGQVHKAKAAAETMEEAPAI
ncbi:MAG: DNA-directed RNA polymerase subunit beta', partial [Chloroflexi bacterium]|nr:DNA-directed RNA polymerase subunit beta' [Chloroflexota bacterium]